MCSGSNRMAIKQSVQNIAGRGAERIFLPDSCRILDPNIVTQQPKKGKIIGARLSLYIDRA